MNCENCNSEHDNSYGSGRFCSLICARGFSTKAKRKEISNKLSLALKGKGHPNVTLTCEGCGERFTVRWSKRKQKACSRNCIIASEKTVEKLRNSAKRRCESVDERIRLRDIGRNGGFGARGTTENGTYYQSLFEKKCFDFLDEIGVKYEAHKNIPTTSNVSDIYVLSLDLWIELDGINREKRKEWLGEKYKYWINKLEIYAKLGLNLKVFTKFKDFCNYFETLGYSLDGKTVLS